MLNLSRFLGLEEASAFKGERECKCKFLAEGNLRLSQPFQILEYTCQFQSILFDCNSSFMELKLEK